MSKIIYGNIGGKRIDSRVLDVEIREAIRQGARDLHVIADGQHGIGGRLWGFTEPLTIRVEGPVGQRLGGMGIFGTSIVVSGSASDDVGWLNCGAHITVLGDVTNGAHNAAAQGKLYVQGSGGARCDTMTKHNPRFAAPESWYFRDVGDTFAEFKAGGVSVVCGINPRNRANILGYRPCVGMVGGVVYFRGSMEGFSEKDVKLLDLTAQDWQWLTENLPSYLRSIDRFGYLDELVEKGEKWRKLIPYTPQERAQRKTFSVSLSDFRIMSWEKEVGKGGLFADYLSHEATLLPYVTTGADRRFIPLWANDVYLPPCEYNCPSGIPTWERTRRIRSGDLKGALELVLLYSPLPATVCGEVCAHLCMDGCTRAKIDKPVNTEEFGKASLEIPSPPRAGKTGRKVAVIGAGAGGLSTAWQLYLKGHDVDIYEAEEKIGGKLEYFIPKTRLPQRVLKGELKRFNVPGLMLRTGEPVDRDRFEAICREYDAVVVAVGTHRPRGMSFEGSASSVTAYDFLKRANTGKARSLRGKDVLILGAGNVGMDVATEAYRLGAVQVTAVDIQKPAAFGKELELARSLGTRILWPLFVDRYVRKERRAYFKDGSSIDADVVIVAIGDEPATDFLPPSVHTGRDGSIVADEAGHTSDPKIFAIGDVVSPGLVTHAIGQGRKAAEAVHALLSGISYYRPAPKPVIPRDRIKTAYYESCQTTTPVTLQTESNRCLSCAVCRDCHMCEATCYYGAISRSEAPDGSWRYDVNADLCIGCGFCAGICPCGVWEMVENT